MNNKRGITLVALVITIVILLILAGISIIGLTKTGLLKNAELAKEEYQKSVKKEQNDLNKINEYIKGNRENNAKESELIQEVTFEVIETKGVSIKVQINVKETNENDARGYFVYINDEVVFDVIGNYGNLEGQVGVYTSNSDVVIKTLDITY